MSGWKKSVLWALAVALVLTAVSPLRADDDDKGKGKKRKKDVLDLVYVERPAVGLTPGLAAIAFIPFSQAVEDREGIFSKREKQMGDELTSAIAQRMQQYAQQFNIPLSIVDRESVAAIMKEKDLADAGLAQENKALQLGKLAKAQAICFGRMTIDVHKREGVSKTLRPVGFPGRGMRIETQDVRQIERTITLSATVKLVAIATGKSLVTFNRRVSETATRKPGFFMGEDAQEIQLRPEDETIERLFTQVVEEFVGQLLPHEVHIEAKVFGPKSKSAKNGLKFLQAGNGEKAIELFQDGLQSKPDDHAALYDLGLAYEITGNPQLALKNYELAYSCKDKNEYIEAAQRVRQKLAAAKAETPASAPANPSSRAPANADESDVSLP